MNLNEYKEDMNNLNIKDVFELLVSSISINEENSKILKKIDQ